MPDLGFLEGQSPWLILAVVLIIAAAYVITRAARKSGDTGNGRQGLDSVDAAADYLTDKAIEEREGRRVAESTLAEARAEMARLVSEQLRISNELNSCNARVRELTDSKGDLLPPSEKKDHE